MKENTKLEKKAVGGILIKVCFQQTAAEGRGDETQAWESGQSWGEWTGETELPGWRAALTLREIRFSE